MLRFLVAPAALLLTFTILSTARADETEDEGEGWEIGTPGEETDAAEGADPAENPDLPKAADTAPAETSRPAAPTPKDTRPTMLQVVPGQAPPPGYMVSLREDEHLVTASIVTMTVSYVTSAIAMKVWGIEATDEAIEWLGFVPIAGPFIASGVAEDLSAGEHVVLLGLGAAQVAGLALSIVTGFVKKPVWELVPVTQTSNVRITPNARGLSVTF